MALDVSVTKFTIVQTLDSIYPHAVYSVQVQYKGDFWEVKKRYSEFREFYTGISGLEPHDLPEFPAKQLFAGADPAVCTNRLLLLDSYMKAVAAVQRFAQSLEVALFLEIYTHIAHEHTQRAPRVLIPLPDVQFDPSEVAVPWKLMQLSGFDVVFATESGRIPKADTLLLQEGGVVFGQLGATAQARKFYYEMEKSDKFQQPLSWADLDVTDYDGLLLGGGHAPGMKQYLESAVLQSKVAEYFALGRPVAAICHGALLAARSKDPTTRESVLRGRKTTTLPKYMENLAYAMTFWKFGKLYRTYDEFCADEVCSVLLNPETDFVAGPLLGHGTMFDNKGAHVVEDNNYISARYPGDAYLLGKRLITQVLASMM